MNIKKPDAPDGLDPFFLQIWAKIIAQPIICIYYLTIEFNKIPEVWETAYVTPVMKGGGPADPNN